MAIFWEVVNKRKSSFIFVLFLEYVAGTQSEFILGRNKLKLFCCVPNLQYKMPHGTQNSNGCLYPLSHMGHFCKDNRERKYFYLTERWKSGFQTIWNIVNSIWLCGIRQNTWRCFIEGQFPRNLRKKGQRNRPQLLDGHLGRTFMTKRDQPRVYLLRSTSLFKLPLCISCVPVCIRS